MYFYIGIKSFRPKTAWKPDRSRRTFSHAILHPIPFAHSLFNEISLG